jgi:5-methylcytosine-specific restriction endonuclease McrA
MREIDLRGNATDRRRRRQWLLDTFGDGTTCPCFDCGRALTSTTLTVDRIKPGALGGRYTRNNIRPACHGCNVSAWSPWRQFREVIELAIEEPEPTDEELAAAYAEWAS